MSSAARGGRREGGRSKEGLSEEGLSGDGRREIGNRATDLRELATVLALVVLGAGGIVFTSSRPWLAVSVARQPPFGPLAAELTGRDEFPALNGLAIVALLIAVLVLVTAGWGRRLLGVLLLVIGGCAAWYAVQGLRSVSSGRLLELLGGRLSQRAAAFGVRHHPVWAYLTLFWSLLLVACALVLVARSGRWKVGMSAKYAAPVEAARSGDPWRSLDRGEDPTISDG